MHTLRLNENSKGRDFVIGDIHGHFDLLELFLDSVAFDANSDRLISVGDLIDRGPHSLDARQYLEQEWFFSVRGNHEALLLDAIADIPGVKELWQQVGGNWAQFASDHELNTLGALLGELPYLIEVSTPHGPVGVVHADFPPEISWNHLFEMAEQDKLTEKQLKTLIWSRQRFRRLSLSLLYPDGHTPDEVPDLHKMYVGHSIVESPQLYGNVMFIDTGAFNGGKLTAIDLSDERVISIENRLLF